MQARPSGAKEVLMSSIYDEVKANYKLPLDLYPFQVETVEELGPLERAGYWLDTGIGKTYTSITSCLYKLGRGDIHHVICVMPPVLITNWSRTLSKIPGVTTVEYRGSPKHRKTLNLNVNFILMGYTIFKLDYERLFGMFQDSTVALLCDEAQAVKNVSSQTYKSVRDFVLGGNHLLLLSGTPLSTPLDGYAYCNLKSPGIYRNQKQFEDIHVAKRDFFEKPVEWANLDLLWDNMAINSKRILKSDVLKDLPAVTYQEMVYDLHPAHLKLYNQLADEQIKALPDGNKIDLTETTALFHALQQIPCNSLHFSGGEIEPTALDVLDEVMDELGKGKLVVFTNYRMTNRLLLERCVKYKAVAIYGEISAKQKQAAIDTFVADPHCRLIVLQWASGGVGIDTLQDVCNDVLCLELPYTAATFNQGIARVHRIGQTMPVTVRIALANRTIQFRIMKLVTDKDFLVNMCIRGVADLRDAIRGL